MTNNGNNKDFNKNFSRPRNTDSMETDNNKIKIATQLPILYITLSTK